ncbi:4a-hydroxytetrahydrobiopterin dehydratase [Pseudobacteriovorax antillogorgiicola]|uniref:4a-hydroxytetrahydrobiopterin dehydratase n=1 Tax=Pseudobacteriovorax antillogorgiicola TaxID=1513793 RepID=A0A1Y6CIP7_9BACT|nr:4a-hydroxytetrahydrobiopterin dehydratase [Pseudobacteriovorax antillogorgiicola]TCS46699.1 pterin-4-alpha-carbinolamine dehydratase [Pseudobacteriovorax antillogorgiicola]SMF66870.1 pterin-4-alpha-carbinolamine dehydratase [Pseudobacteriovorax antillogorgiicola]
MSQVLDLHTVATFARKHPGWMLDGHALKKVFSFKGFPDAVRFIEAMVSPAEDANHHPDINVVYRTVTIRLWTHDQGGITQKDLDLAQVIDRLT